jgi:DNA adenine methylase
MNVYSPLRYPGGKRRIAPYLKKILKDNQLCDGVYVEPYAGGASVALSLLLDGYVSKIIINDVDQSVYAFWWSVLNETNEFCKLIEETPVTIPNWKEQAARQRNKQKCSLIELGFSTFFLNRTNRSGILSAGVIGGITQDGQWKIDSRYNKIELIERIQRIARHKKQIELRNSDALELIKSIKKSLPEKSIIYMDPPYYVKGSALYLNYYKDRDHKQIFEDLQLLENIHWILTYDNVEVIRNLYKNFRQEKYNLRYTASRSVVGQELMIFSDRLKVVKPLRRFEKGGHL